MIVLHTNPILRMIAEEVDHHPSADTRSLVELMRSALEKSVRPAIGLSAPQIGISKRVIIYRLRDQPARVVLNPVLTKPRGEQIGPEGCLSLPADVQVDVRRAESVLLHGYTLHGRRIKYRVSGLEARVVQHEVDHLNGVLIIDNLSLQGQAATEMNGAGAAT